MWKLLKHFPHHGSVVRLFLGQQCSGRWIGRSGQHPRLHALLILLLFSSIRIASRKESLPLLTRITDPGKLGQQMLCLVFQNGVVFWPRVGKHVARPRFHLGIPTVPSCKVGTHRNLPR
ncbi:hypothetical protein AVEN_266510-1 [Araneus ventricosus]|uniref:Uncharacterized protein n=1 Tax=Araneus ventricosus TaxID=182803 RepID=A0A4Y2WAE2_ARAVE|nr:hypothetical protein AVEN_266510-1 [Araneus ventricosus]